MSRKFIGTRKRATSVNSDEHTRKPMPEIRKDSLTLEQALARFVRAKEAEGVRPRTIHAYHNHIGYLIDYFTEIKGVQKPFLDDITSDLIREYITYQLTEKRRYEGEKGRKDKTVGLSPNTVNIRLRTLRTMCRFWYTEGLAKVNAMENVKFVSADQTEEVPGLTDAELEMIFASFDETQYAEWRDKILCMLLIDTGLRIQEAVSLTEERVDFGMLAIYVPSQIAKNRRNREVPMSREVARLLRDLMKETADYFGDVEQIFVTAYGEPLNSDAFRKRLNRLKTKLGIERLSPHMFRHTFCRNYLLNGGDLFTLQKIVDHADIKTTRKYVQMDVEHVRSQHNKYSPLKRLYKRK